MQRRSFLAVATGSAVIASWSAHARPGPVPLVGYLGPPPSVGGFVQAFQRGLAELGYAEGRNLKVEYRYNVAVEGNLDRLAELSAELVGLRPDVLVVSLTEVALAMKKATQKIPIVMANVSDPVAAGLVASLARPGGNLTGVSRQTPELIGKQFQILKEMLPKAALVGFLLNPTDQLHPVIVEIIRTTAATLGVGVMIQTPSTPAELADAFATLHARRADAVLVGDGGVLYLSRLQIAELALANRIPSMSSYPEPVESGGLISYSASSLANYRRAAFFVDRILKGAKPADLPIEQPTAFRLVINMKTARALGIAMPQSLLLRADDVFQ